MKDGFDFWHELHRRRVLRVLATYAVLAFVVLNGLAGAVHYYEWSESIVRVGIWLAAIMSPIVVVTAWVFDYTPWGILRTPPHGELPKKPTGLMDRRVEAIIIGLLLIALGVAIRGTYDELAMQEAAPPVHEAPRQLE